MKCIQMNWLSIIVGQSGTGKTTLIQLLAELTGNNLYQFWMNSAIDTMELLGGFEQVDISRRKIKIIDNLIILIQIFQNIYY